MSTNELALSIENFSAGYGRYDVVKEVSLHIKNGESVALLGPNGAGKTTLLRSIMGLTKHRRGKISVMGEEITDLPLHEIARGRVSIVPEGRRLFLNQSVEDNLILGSLRFKKDKNRVNENLERVFSLFPVVERYRNRPATDLSGGEQQMVAIGRMMMSDPELMLLDEPSLGLAPLAIADMVAALIKLRDDGHSILLVEQRIDLALQLCDRVYVLSAGSIVEEITTKTLDQGERALLDAYLG
jgi:branched-chain amino acid transport system ATP-binding protein